MLPHQQQALASLLPALSLLLLLLALSHSASALVLTAAPRGGLNTSAKGTVTDFSGLDAWIDVSWDDIPAPRLKELGLNDIVALYTINSGEPLNISTQDPFAYIYPIQVNATHWLEGHGSYTFYLTNHRVPIAVLYLRGHSYYNATIQQQIIINNTSPNIPMQITLAVTADRSAYRVTWSIRDPFPGAVRWGRSPTRLTSAVVSNTSTYTRDDLCGLTAGGSGWASPGTINTALITGLRPNTRYYYQVGGAYGLSDILSFMTPHSNTVRMLAWADQGAYNPDNARPVLGTFADQFERAVGTADPYLLLTYVSCLSNLLGVGMQNSAWVTMPALAAEVKKQRYHAAAVNGDLSYAYGSLQRWDTWLHQIQPVISSMPLITSPGNHESDSDQLPLHAFPDSDEDSGGECGVPYDARLGMPVAAPRREWFSTDIGPVHFIQISTEQNFNVSSEQYAFILSDLQSVDRTKTPWVIAGFHRPLYVDDPDTGPAGNYRISAWLRDNLEPLFVKYQVDMTWSGHIHAYHRSCPVINGTCVNYDRRTGEALAPVHIIMGHAGGEPGLVTFAEVPNWAIVDMFPSFGYCTMETTKTKLSLVVYGGNFTNQTSLPVIDSITLKKPRGWKPDAAAAELRYNSTVPTPPQPSIYSSGDLVAVVEVVNAGLARIIEEDPVVALVFAACFAPETKAFALTNALELPIVDVATAWELTYPILTLLKAAYKPDTSNATQVQWQASLDFAYNLIALGRQRAGTPAPGCHLY